MDSTLDLYRRFSRKRIQDRQVDTLVGLSKGLVADGRIDVEEASFLHTWLVQNASAADNPIIGNLLGVVDGMLADGRFDEGDLRELFRILRLFSGEESQLGELGKTTALPLDLPEPRVRFAKHTFLFTGTCAYGTRQQCQDATEALGGVNQRNVTKKLNYLVLGTYVSESWAHETYGRKIEKAVQYREAGVPIAIISERCWAEAGGLI